MRLRRVNAILLCMTAALGGRAATAAPPPLADGAWTLAILPDTQYYSQSYPQIFESQTRWIADNKDARRIRFVLHEGDITNNNTAAQWENAKTAIAILKQAGVPFALVPGNHDLGPNGGTSNRDTLMNDYFSAADYANSATVGFFEEGKMENSFHTFEADGQKYVVLALEFGPRDAVVEWADRILSEHADHTGILLTHAYIYSNETRYDWAKYGSAQTWNPHSYGIGSLPGGSNDGEELWQKLVAKHPSMAFTFNGHVLNDGAGHVVSFNNAGKVVHQILANYQTSVVKPTSVNGGDGYLRLVEFQPDGKTVKIVTYSPYNDTVMTDSDQTFTISLNPADYKTVVAGNLSVVTGSAVNTPAVTVPSSHPAFGVGVYTETLANVPSPNDGDYQITAYGVGLAPHAGALLASVRENGRTVGTATQIASVETPYNAFVDGRSSLAVSEAGYTAGAKEANANVAAAYFPYAGGWRAAFVNASGQVQFGGGIAASEIKALGVGRYQVTLTGVDSTKDGMLFAVGSANEDNVAGAAVNDDGSWLVTVRDNGTDFSQLEPDFFTVLYMPYSAKNLVGGRIAEDGTTVRGVGDYTLTREAAGVYRLRVTGQSPDTGMLLLTVEETAAGTGGIVAGEDSVLTYEADGADFLIRALDTPGLALEDTSFHFAFIGFQNPPSLPDPVALSRLALRVAGGQASLADLGPDGTEADRDANGTLDMIDAVAWMRAASGL